MSMTASVASVTATAVPTAFPITPSMSVPAVTESAVIVPAVPAASCPYVDAAVTVRRHIFGAVRVGSGIVAWVRNTTR
jgi:hypothetical protein